MKTLLIYAMLSFVGATSQQLFYNATQASQLAYFVAKIATQSFSPDKILHVSSTQYNDTVDTMLNCVQKYAMFHFQVSLPENLGRRGMKEQDHNVGSYVIFKTRAEDSVTQAEGLMDNTSKNKRAMFLVVLRTPTASPERLAFQWLRIYGRTPGSSILWF